MRLISPNLDLYRKLGSGAFGEVYLAQDEIHGEVAVKVIARRSSETADSWAYRSAMFLKEGNCLKAAQHPNVVTIHDVRRSGDGNAVLLVMEFCSLGSCEQPYQSGPIPISRTQQVLQDAALGLEAVHSRGMLHRDVKPANILIDQDGRAKLGDFGLVTDDLIYGYAARMGYIDHLAPEVYTRQCTSVRTDVWAFGMTTYRLLHGDAFYTSQRPQIDVRAGGFGKRLKWLPHIPAKWQRVVRKMLHDDPAARTNDAAALWRELSQLPNSPDWECKYSDSEVDWVRSDHRRLYRVTWRRKSSRNTEWEALSLPLKSNEGRRRKLDGSEGMVGIRQAEQGLRKFFKNQE